MPAIDAFQKKVFTAHAFYTPTGGKMIELSDNETCDYIPDVERVTSLAPGKGIHTRDVMPARVTGARFELLANRLTGEQLQVVLASQSPTTQTQAAATGLTASFSSVYKGQPLDLGKEMVSSAVVTKGATTLVAGTDFTIDTFTGVIRLLKTSVAYTDGDTIQVQFNCALVTRKQLVGNGNINQYGQAKLILFDTSSGQGRFVVDFPCQLTCDETIALSGGNDIVKVKYKLQALAAINWNWLAE